jgi:DNA-binding response OmpR family regulator
MGIHEKVFLVEDDEKIVQLVREELKRAGHEIIGYADNLGDCFSKGIPEAITSGMTVAVVDGELGFNPGGCQDGKDIAGNIRKKAPEVTIVAFSKSQEEIANYGDFYVDKNPKKLARALTMIPRK